MVILYFLGEYSWGSTYEIKLDDISCPNEDWNSCSYIEEHNCDHSSDVYLNCGGKLRLHRLLRHYHILHYRERGLNYIHHN